MERPTELCSICGKPSVRNRMQIIWKSIGTAFPDEAEKTWAHGTCKRNALHQSPRDFRFHVKIWLRIVNRNTRSET